MPASKPFAGGADSSIPECAIGSCSTRRTDGTLTIVIKGKAGTEAIEEQVSAQLDMIGMIVKRMVSDASHISPTFAALQRRINTKRDEIVAQDCEKFTKAVSTLAKVDVAWMSEVVKELSDLLEADIAKCLEFDLEAAATLISAETQIPLSMVLGPELNVKEVLRAVIMHFAGKNGGLLKEWKARGGLKPDGSLNLAAGVYKIEFNDGEGNDAKLKKITHRASGEHVGMADGIHITKSYKLRSNHSERLSSLVKAPYPPTKLIGFFAKGKGPHARKVITPQSEEWKTAITSACSNFTKAKADALRASSASSTMQQAVDKVRDDKRKADLEKLREQAMTRSTGKKVKRETSLT